MKGLEQHLLDLCVYSFECVFATANFGAALMFYVSEGIDLRAIFTSITYGGVEFSRECAQPQPTINVRANIFSGGDLEILKKRQDINYFSQSADKLRSDIFSGEGVVVVVTRLTR